MPEYAEHDIEKLSTAPIIHDGTHPNPSADDDGGEAAAVALVGMPSNGDVPVFNATSGKHFPGDPGGGISRGTPGNGIVVFLAADGEPFVLGGLPSGPVAISEAWVWRDLSSARWAVGQSQVDIAGSAGSYLDAEYSLDGGATWPDVIGVAVPIDATGPARPDPVPVPVAARTLVLLRPVGGGGDAVASPEILTFLVDFTSSEPPV
jgi:hypothetical protein